MRHIAATLAVVVALLFSAGSTWADLDEGMAAFKRGDSATAFLEWFTSAEQGLALAQYNLGIMSANGNVRQTELVSSDHVVRKF
jgi:TPR repeat protein